MNHKILYFLFLLCHPFSSLKNYWRNRRIKKQLPKTVDIKSATQKDLEALGRTVYACKAGLGKIEQVKTSMVAVRNKKNGRVVMCCWPLDQIKSKFGNDYEIVESEIKEETNGEIDLNKDGFFSGNDIK